MPIQHRVVEPVDAPTDLVWAVLADLARWPEWTPTVTRAVVLDDGPLLPGLRVRISQPRLPTRVWTVEEVDPGRSFTWSCGPRSGRTRATHALVELPDGRTRVELGLEQRGLAVPAGALLRPLVRRYVETEARALRDRCAGGGGRPAP